MTFAFRLCLPVNLSTEKLWSRGNHNECLLDGSGLKHILHVHTLFNSNTSVNNLIPLPACFIPTQ